MRSRRHDCHAVNAICTIHLLLLQLRVAQVGPSPLQIVLHQVWGLAQGKCLLEGHCFKGGGRSWAASLMLANVSNVRQIDLRALHSFQLELHLLVQAYAC